jgi:hypothetical protein
MLIRQRPAILCAMPAQVVETPNPNAHKYVLSGRRFEHSRNFANAEAAAGVPLAARLFALDGVYNVFLAQDFVTVNKRPEAQWELLDPQVLLVLTGEAEGS